MPPNPQRSTFLMWQIRKCLDGKPYRIISFIELLFGYCHTVFLELLKASMLQVHKEKYPTLWIITTERALLHLAYYP